ncbi:MAG: hypothetical protein BMS9Abin36_0498 [Gammaproteobacteria bacterium]|nr:MAG: hypothetical protein BMS9Abin36_0498 [Gammaproteobacteria bacterium]
MPDFFERVLLLKKAPIFSAVLTEDLRVVAQELREEPCFTGERVFDIHDPSDKAYIIQEGRIGISIHTDPKIKDFIAELGFKECFGEMGLFDDQPRSATAHVLEDGILLAIGKSKLRALVIRYPELSLGIMRSLSLRLRDSHRHVKHV